MLFLIALILAVIFAVFCGKTLKKCPYAFYGAAVVITVASVIIAGADMRNVPVFLNQYVIALFTRGAFATALWCVVMWSGAFPNGSVPIKKLMPIRGELSIFAAILTLGHNIGFGRTYFVRLFTDAGRMSGNQIAASILTIIMLLIMIPLTIISFPQIRRKMNPKIWKRVQRTAYLFYGLIYVHVFILYYPMAKAGRDGIFFNILIYSIVFIGYAVCRIRKYVVIRKKPEKTLILNIISSVVFLIAVSGALFSVRAEKKTVTVPINNTQVISDVTTSASNSEMTTTTVSTGTGTTQTVVASSSISGTVTTSSTFDEEDEEETTTEEVQDEENNEDNPEENENEEPVENSVEEPEEPPQPEPSYMYRNGVFSASAYGYDGEVYVDVTIENDVITSVSARTEESDTWYFESAEGSVISQIIANQNPYVDAVSGATYSSEAIMTAVQKALDSARN